MSDNQDALDCISERMTFSAGSGELTPKNRLEWVEAIELANHHLLAATLFSRMRSAGRDGDLPDQARDYLALLLELNAERNEALRGQAREIFAAFDAAGIPLLLLKGAITLFDSTDPLRHSRMMRDLDILVPRKAEREAAKALRELGYEINARYPPGHHAYGEFWRERTPGMVDLHSELVDPSYILPASEVFSRSRSLEMEARHVAVPAPTDRMLHHLLHAQIHHRGQYYRGELKLDQVFDCALVARRFAAEIDWEFIEMRLEAHRLARPLHSYLLAAERLFGLPWPLATPPRTGAKAHLRRCLLQLRHPAVGQLMTPLANLRSAFAWHRMRALHGESAAPAVRPMRHLHSYIRKKSMREAVERIFR